MQTLIRVTELIARLKAWQVFLLITLPAFAGQYLVLRSFSFQTMATPTTSTEGADINYGRFVTIALLSLIPFLVWVFSIAWAANRRVQETLRPSMRLAFSCAVLIVGYSLLANYIWPQSMSISSEQESMALALPLLLMALVALIYTLLFSARNITMAEWQSSVSVTDYKETSLWLWFFPIGVWFIQPRLNDLMVDHKLNH